MAILIPSEFPWWGTNGAPSAIDTPFASAGRIATGWTLGDVPSPKTQNGWQFWVSKHLEYLEQDRVVPKSAGYDFLAVAGTPTLDPNTKKVTLDPGESFQIEVPLEPTESVVQVRFRHQDQSVGPTGILTVQFGYARDGATTPIGAPVNFMNSNNVWVWDTYTFAPGPYVHAADTDILEGVLSNTGGAIVTVQVFETTYRKV